MIRPLIVNVARIPESLTAVRRWVMWRYENRDGRQTKMPRQPNGQSAKANDPATWSTFAIVIAEHSTRRFDGIGFCLGDGWAGVDLDHCRDAAGGDVSDTGRFFTSALDCYVEVSPSGTGYKAFGRGPRIGGQIDCANDPPSFSTWQGARFFAVTGHGTGDPTADLSKFIDNWFPAPFAPPRGSPTGYQDAVNVSDDELVSQAVGADNGDKFLCLWRGDTSGYGHDHSRADLALVGMLAFWTNYDVERIDRMFRKSGLMRPKWETNSYRLSTLTKAAGARPRALPLKLDHPEGNDLDVVLDDTELEEIPDSDDELEVVDPHDLFDDDEATES